MMLVKNEAAEFVSIPSHLLGDIRIPTGDLLHFPAGLLGFPECRSFALVEARTPGSYWLQSVEHPVLVFLLVDPFLVSDEYAVDLAPYDMASLKVKDASEIAMLAIVTLPGASDEPATANLQGPVALNLRARLGKQVANDKTAFGLRCPIDLKRIASNG